MTSQVIKIKNKFYILNNIRNFEYNREKSVLVINYAFQKLDSYIYNEGIFHYSKDIVEEIPLTLLEWFELGFEKPIEKE